MIKEIANLVAGPAGAIVLAALGLAASSAAHTETPIERLKTAYLECERAAIGGELVTDGIMRCSIIYEELKKRAFDGDFSRFKAWADEHKAAEWSS